MSELLNKEQAVNRWTEHLSDVGIVPSKTISLTVGSPFPFRNGEAGLGLRVVEDGKTRRFGFSAPYQHLDQWMPRWALACAEELGSKR